MANFVKVPDDVEYYKIPWFDEKQDEEFAGDLTFINADNVLAVEVDEPSAEHFARARIVLSSSVNIIFNFSTVDQRNLFLASFGVDVR